MSGFTVGHYQHPIDVGISRFAYVSRKPRDVTINVGTLRSSCKTLLRVVRFSIKSEHADKILVKIANIKLCGSLSDGSGDCLSEHGDRNGCCLQLLRPTVGLR